MKTRDGLLVGLAARAVVAHERAPGRQLAERVAADDPVEVGVAERALDRPSGRTSSWAPTWGPSITVASAERFVGGRAGRGRSTKCTPVVPRERLDEEVDRAAAGEADGEGLVVAVAERDEARGRRRSSTSSASVTTAPSTQPPDTEPMTSPDLVDGHGRARVAGPEPSRSTTRASATCWPASRQRSMSCVISFTASTVCPRRDGRPRPRRGRRGRERGQRMALDEVVDVGERGGHAPGQRLVARRRLERVDPDHAVGDPAQAGHLLGQQLGIAPVPAVGQDDDHRPAGQARRRPSGR